jgi:hypothetical protein
VSSWLQACCEIRDIFFFFAISIDQRSFVSFRFLLRKLRPAR